jgi:hypothetical protein
MCTHLRLASLNKGIPSDIQCLPDLPSSFRQQSHKLNQPHSIVANQLPTPAHPPNRQVIPECLGLPDITLQRVIRLHVLFMLDLEADGFEADGRGEGAVFRGYYCQIQFRGLELCGRGWRDPRHRSCTVHRHRTRLLTG